MNTNAIVGSPSARMNTFRKRWTRRAVEFKGKTLHDLDKPPRDHTSIYQILRQILRRPILDEYIRQYIPLRKHKATYAKIM